MRLFWRKPHQAGLQRTPLDLLSGCLVERGEHIVLALALDGLLGDPRWFPHPAKITGRIAQRLERLTRRSIKNEKVAGVVTAFLVTTSAAVAAAAVVRTARRLHPVLGDAASVLALWTAFAPRDLADHALDVYRALSQGRLGEARRLVGRMVGRNVAVLDEAGVVRAAVESVAENTVDGVTAPLFYAFVGGPVAAAAYKAVSTLDSSFGYRNDRYLHFGWASARLDDLANYLPARLTVVAFVIGAALLRLDSRAVLKTVLQDARKHASPNSGFAEAAVAGALGVQLGGPLMRGEERLDLPTIGQRRQALQQEHIPKAVELMAATTLSWVALLWLARRLFRVVQATP